MTDTARTISQLLALYANNSTGDISPQDGRDMIETLKLKYGELYIESSAATTISNTSDYFDVAGTWTLGEAEQFDESGGNGLLTYVGTPDVIGLLIVTLSFTAASGTNTCHFRTDKNGAAVHANSEEIVIGTTLPLSVSIFDFVELSTGDELSVSVRNETGAVNVTASNGHVICLGFAA